MSIKYLNIYFLKQIVFKNIFVITENFHYLKYIVVLCIIVIFVHIWSIIWIFIVKKLLNIQYRINKL